MLNPTEKDEREYLELIKEKLRLAINRLHDRVKQVSAELRESKQYIHENQSGLDEADLVAADQSINRIASTGETEVTRRNRLLKLVNTPYFARIDFTPQKSSQLTSMYIGRHTFFDETERANLIYDWRAPVSSMFYDFELGEAWYATPNGKVPGNISLKRQYHIRDGMMEFMLENNVNILDDVLQRELSKASDDKMKSIVATIQREQNAIIRNEESRVLLIQGVAGSGKTSIALHRIAFMLYRFRETLKAKDILIISPNKVFADYIGNVLPELGEENIPEMGMEELAAEILQNKFTFQTFFQQVSQLLNQPAPDFVERIQFKASFEFLSKLNQYMVFVENNFFEARELRAAGVVVPSPFIHEKFKSYHRMPLLNRMPMVVKDIHDYIRDQTKRKLSGSDKLRIWETVPKMIKVNQLIDLYKGFYKWIGKPHLFHQMGGGMLEYADVFPLIYCKIRLEGVNPYNHVKHLLIDEMQDYTPVQYAVISRLFSCKKTILGDITQTVNPYSSSSAETLERVFPQADVIRLLRSYRSTIEITTFALRLVPNPDLVPMERHGEEPLLKSCTNRQQEVEWIKSTIRQTDDISLGIVLKTAEQAEALWRELELPPMSLLNAESTAFKRGVIVTSAHLAKGLEFDEVIVPFVTQQNYHTEIDKRMLYIACTRAMHKLTLTFTGEKSTLV